MGVPFWNAHFIYKYAHTCDKNYDIIQVFSFEDNHRRTIQVHGWRIGIRR